MEIIDLKENRIRELVQELVPRPALHPEKTGEGGKDARVPAVPARAPQELQALTESINHFMKAMQYSLQFVLEGPEGGIVIKVLDGKGHLIRRIPPEALHGLAAKMGAGVGVVVNKTLE